MDKPCFHQVTFELRPRPPFRLDLTTWALRRRARNLLDTWDGRYRRPVLIDGVPIAIEVVQDGPREDPTLTVAATASTELSSTLLPSVRAVVERLLGLQVDLDPFYDLADAHPRLRPLKDRFLGVKPPRFPAMFEALANAVANQQLSLEVGIELLNRLTSKFGTPVFPGNSATKTFPEARSVAGASTGELRDLGFSNSKAQYLIGLADVVSSGDLDFDQLESMGRADATRSLQRLHGIGRWSAEYVLLRGAGRLDVFPSDDVGARNKLQRLLALPCPPSYREIVTVLDCWHPYAGLVYFHLLLDGLAERGVLEV
ncbi:MAG: DNA-3-methyladenine glycosylase 2 family protein [Ilumatobacteraceae bacterium]